MKKLMIAAAAVAMIGAAEAVPQGWTSKKYQFVANLQTTTGASAIDVVASSYTYRLGDNGGSMFTAKFWYKDQKILDEVKVSGEQNATYEWEDAATAAKYKNLGWYVKLADDGVKLIPALQVISADGTINNDEKDLLNYLETNYGYGTGKPSTVLCCEIPVLSRASGCYRVAGANYIEEELSLNRLGCCSAPGAWAFTKGAANMVQVGGNYRYNCNNHLDQTFAYRFGAFESVNANLVEIYAQVIDAPTKAGWHGAGVLFNGWLAGQGDCEIYADNGAELTVKCPNSITGSIVGFLNCSLCDVCCDTPVATRAFLCFNNTTLRTETEAQGDKTAAYGTFYLNRID